MVNLHLECDDLMPQALLNQETPFQVLLYYNFVPVPDPQGERDRMEAFCLENNLLGRILIASEGLNGTVSGRRADIRAYMDWIGRHPVFHATEWKIDDVPAHTFLKLHVRVKNEIVNLGVEDLDMNIPVDNYVEPAEFRELLKKDDPDIVILDARSNYETEVGRFKNALTLDIENFRDLPAALEQLEAYKDKQIYTYCTGGIKCEKVSRLMMQKGFKNVYQLHGGIIRYGHEAGGEDFEGSCYVFDQRVVVPVNHVNPDVLGHCKLCDGATEKMINCASPECNAHILICDACAVQFEGCCSEACLANPKRRAYDGTGYYLRGVNSKLYVSAPEPNYIRNLKAGKYQLGIIGEKVASAFRPASAT